MPDDSPARRLRLLVALAVLVLSLAGGELFLRTRIHPPADDEVALFAQPPLSRLRVTISRDLAGLPKRSTLFTTNALGLRGDDLDLADHTDTRVLTLGDSVTECLLLADEDAWPRVLQDALNSRAKRKVWVGNASSSGLLVSDYVAHAHLLVPQLKPDLLVVMPGGHDFQAVLEDALLPVDLSDPGRLREYGKKLYVKANLDDLRSSYLGFLLAGRFLETELDMTDFYEKARQRRRESKPLPELPDIEDGLDIFRSGLVALVRAVREQKTHTDLVFVTHPSLWRAGLDTESIRTLWGGYTCLDCPTPAFYHHEALAKGIAAFNQTLLDVCRAESVHCVDVAANVDKTQENFYDDAHMREAGAHRTAQLIATSLLEKGLVR